MTTEPTEAPRKRRPRIRTLEVRRAAHLTAGIVRVTLGGPELEGFDTPTPTQHVKLFLPEPGRDRPVLPDPNLPRGEGPQPLMRTYTIRRLDLDRLEMDIDFALHSWGIASDWAANAQPGAVVGIAGPGGRPCPPDDSSAWYVLAGDEAALPAMGTLLEAISPSIPVRLLAEVPSANDRLDWNRANLQVTWLDRAGDAMSAGSRLEAALRATTAPAGSGRVWLACEATAMRRIRRHLLDGWGLDPSAMVTRGYWKQGEVNYPDHDYGED